MVCKFGYLIYDKLSLSATQQVRLGAHCVSVKPKKECALCYGQKESDPRNLETQLALKFRVSGNQFQLR